MSKKGTMTKRKRKKVQSYKGSTKHYTENQGFGNTNPTNKRRINTCIPEGKTVPAPQN